MPTSPTHYTSDHEWLLIEDDIATIGVTDYAQQSLGEVVYVELPEVGTNCSKGDSIATIESVKAASDVYAPLEGEIIAINDELEDSPELVNDDAEGAAWFFKIRLNPPADTSQWMDRETYMSSVEE
ncbi:MAG: glycine cleavage system protein GcvH [Arenicella sp.]